MVQETREPTGHPHRQGENKQCPHRKARHSRGFGSRAFLLGGNSANQCSIIYFRTSPATGITCCTFSTKQGYLKFALLHFCCVLFRWHVYELTFMSEGELEGGFAAQQGNINLCLNITISPLAENETEGMICFQIHTVYANIYYSNCVFFRT